MKIAINRCFGGFSVAEGVYNELDLEWNGYGYLCNEDFDIESENYNEWRSAPRLIAAIEKLGEEVSSGSCAAIEVVDIPDGIEWFIDEYDGQESIHEEHRSW